MKRNSKSGINIEISKKLVEKLRQRDSSGQKITPNKRGRPAKEHQSPLKKHVEFMLQNNKS